MSGVVRPRGRLTEFASSFVLISGMALLLAPAGLAQTTAKPVITPAAKPESAPQVAAPKADAAAVDTDATRYIIGPDDSLQITVWQEPSVSGTFPVRPDGMISLVLVGDIPAAGLTPMHLAHDITLKLKKYIQDPIVSVVVAAVRSQRVYLVGEIQHAGPIELTAGMTPLQAIAQAGGLTPYTSGKHIYILRGPQGKQTKIPFNYKLALKGDNSQDVPLLPGDTIVVP
ncbi:polysaccharide biosynthesis/export family protein [Granulicella sp. L46]|jgi:polysaccharide biosynthesis/export protein|uniref:polysaccharide biosynthesis/export family protein n=1 Tax=Granulicella sp. L46 TaxID=1641865 RepID=UPI0020B1786B|nr:polysaccharide biosynthesis/export family protein [Granulicella sp. L46]